MHYLIIENALPPQLLADIRQAIGQGPFSDGKITANGMAREAKHNLQLEQQVHATLLDRIARALQEQPALQAFAIARHIGRPLINRYEPGMTYGLHVDGAFMGELRADISYTLFLEDPAGYEGGELVINHQSQNFSFKLAAGSLLLYPNDCLHEVRPVTRGVRHAAAGWIQSRIRSAEHREILGKLSAVPQLLGRDEQYQALALQTNECVQRLMRMWGD